MTCITCRTVRLVKTVAIFLCLLLAPIGATDVFAYGYTIQAYALDGQDPLAVMLTSTHTDGDGVLATTLNTGLVTSFDGTATGSARASMDVRNNGSIPVMTGFASASGSSGAGATISYSELLYDFRWADPTKSAPIPLTIFADFHAQFNGTDLAYPHGYFSYSFFDTADVVGTNNINRFYNLGCGSCAPNLDIHNSYPFLLLPGISSINASIGFSINVGSIGVFDSGSIDASHTASFSLSVPEGVTYRSSLGEITSTSVPEPSTISFLGLSLGALVLWPWKHHAGKTLLPSSLHGS